MAGSISTKKFGAIVAVWFVISFLVLWFLGGACTNIVNGSSCLAQNALSGAKNIPVIGLFLPLDTWSSVMYFFAPVAGFFLAFFIIQWWNNHFESSEASGLWFLVVIIIVLLAGYYINLSIYVGETAAGATKQYNGQVKFSTYFCMAENDYASCNDTVNKINNELISQAQSSGAGSFEQKIGVAFWPEIRRSMFFSFILGAVAGWIPLFARRILEGKKEEK